MSKKNIAHPPFSFLTAFFAQKQGSGLEVKALRGKNIDGKRMD
jgi:hypothetical protein